MRARRLSLVAESMALAVAAGVALMLAGCAAPSWRARFVDAGRVSEEFLRQTKAQGFTAVALEVSSPETRAELLAAQPRVRDAGLDLYAWVRVGRDPVAADAHPEWLHVPQHDEWLEGKQGKHGVYPWVCVNNRQVFAHEKARLVSLFEGLHDLAGVFVSDIQGPPAGCGCGNTLCRSWDNSAGDKVAPSPYDKPDVFYPLVFLAETRKSLPGQKLIPVFCPECEFGVTLAGIRDPDGRTGACRGIKCHTCGEGYWPGLIAAADDEEALGVLCLYKELGRDLSLYGPQPAAWVGESVRRVRAHAGAPVVAVVQGWDVTPVEIARQEEEARAAGARGIVVAERELDQSWSARPLVAAGK